MAKQSNTNVSLPKNSQYHCTQNGWEDSCSSMFLFWYQGVPSSTGGFWSSRHLGQKKAALLRIFLLQSNCRDDTLIWSLTFTINFNKQITSFDGFESWLKTNPFWSVFTWPWPAQKHQGNLAFKTQSLKLSPNFQDWSVHQWKPFQKKVDKNWKIWSLIELHLVLHGLEEIACQKVSAL